MKTQWRKQMKIKYLLLLCCVLLFSQGCQKSPGSKRKIKLSDQGSVKRTDEQLSTTIYLEPTLRRAIAVMFFENRTGDSNLEWLQKGLTEMFIRALSQSQHLSVLSTDRLYEILNRLSEMSSPDEIDMDMAAFIAKEANAEILLTGNISKSGDSLKLNVKVHETDQGELLREESVEGSGLENIFSMVDHLTNKIKGDLQLTLDKDESSRGIADITTKSLEAWQSYTTGDDFMKKYMVDEAIPHFEQAIKLDSTFVSAYLDLYPIYVGRGEDNRAFQLFQRCQSLRDKATPQERYQIDLLDAMIKNDATLFIATIKEWLDRYPEDRDANFRLADMYASWNNYDQAIDYWKNVINIDPKYKIAYNRLGYAYANMGNFSKSLSFIKQYKELADGEPNPYDSMGEIYFLYGDYKKAEKNFKKALEIDKGFNGSRNQLANLYLERGNYKKALNTYRDFLERASNDITRASAYSMMAHTYWRLGERDSAVVYYEKALERNPFDFLSIERLNDIHLEIGENERANERLEKTYHQFITLLESDITQFRAFYSLLALSTFWNVFQEETIRLLEDIIENSATAPLQVTDQVNLTNIKFGLTLLFLQTHRENEIDRLWPSQEIIPEELWAIFKDIRTYSYSDNWRAFSLLNRLYYRDLDSGISFYEHLIEYSLKNDVQAMEMMFRLLLADLYFHAGDKEDGKRQTAFVGMPEEETWMVIGPFDNKDGFRKKYPPEKSVNLKKTYNEKSRDIQWQHANDEIYDGFINMRSIFQKSNWSVGYGLIYVLSPEEKKVQFRFGTDDGSKIWFNDKEIWKFNQSGPALFDDNKITVVLEKGLNKILIKVCSQVGDWGFFFRITDKEGNGIENIQFISPDALEEQA